MNTINNELKLDKHTKNVAQPKDYNKIPEGRWRSGGGGLLQCIALLWTKGKWT